MKRLTVEQIMNDHWLPQALDADTNPEEQYLYRVTKVTNSTTPQIRQQLSVKELDVYCDDDAWEVAIS